MQPYSCGYLLQYLVTAVVKCYHSGMDPKDTKVTIQIEDKVWHQFRMGCLQRRLVAGRVVEELLRSQLAKWEKEKPK